ncbi:MAG: SpoIID/LytB domain-containing protein [Clostridiales bacterium]|nr:SpoIID/LytB domain-containing protein [Clostridiales bacterium]
MLKQPRSADWRTAPIRLIITVALAILVAASMPVAALAETEFTFRGRGNGHGVGMSQFGARGFALQGYSFDAILRHYYTGTALGSVPEGNTIRVALQATDIPARSWTFTAHQAPLWLDWSGRGGAEHIRLKQGVTYRVSTGGSTSAVTITDVNSGAAVVTLLDTSWVHLWERDTTKPLFTGLTRVHEASGPQSWTNVLYPGWIRLDRGSGSAADELHLRNLVQLEDYVKCVVPREVPASWPTEVVKAQAVAARSYAFTSKRPTAAFDVWCTTQSQVYNGWGRWLNGHPVRHNETSPGVGGDWHSDAEVDATRNRVVTHLGSPVATYFFSTSGGFTENSENVWSAALPYVRGVPDPYEHLAGSPSHTLADIRLTATQLRSRLLAAGFTSAQLPGVITGVRVLQRGVSGRVLAFQLLSSAGDHRTFTAQSDVRRLRTGVSNGTWNTTWIYVNPRSSRIAGPDRYGTAVEVSKRAFGSAQSVVLVGGSAPADALAASAFAASLPNGSVHGAPILLTDPGRLSEATQAEIERLGASRVYVIGGNRAVGEAVVDELRMLPTLSAPESVERIGGENRYGTAALLADRIEQMNGPSDRVFVVNGETLVDALAVSPVAYARRIPIIPVRSASIPAESAAVLDRPAITRTLVVGGAGAVSDDVVASLQAPLRVAQGSDRYETAVRVAEWAVANESFRREISYVASGLSLLDALAAAPLAGGWRHSIFFARTHALPDSSADALRARSAQVTAVRMLGGPGALGNGVEASIERALE